MLRVSSAFFGATYVSYTKGRIFSRMPKNYGSSTSHRVSSNLTKKTQEEADLLVEVNIVERVHHDHPTREGAPLLANDRLPSTTQGQAGCFFARGLVNRLRRIKLACSTVGTVSVPASLPFMLSVSRQAHGELQFPPLPMAVVVRPTYGTSFSHPLAGPLAPVCCCALPCLALPCRVVFEI